jgi:flagellar motor switch protein FliM
MSDPTSILLAGRSKDSQDAMPVIEEFLRSVGNRLRAKLVNRTSSDIQVDLQDVVIQSIEAIRRMDEFAAEGVFGLLRFGGAGLPGLAALQRGLLTKVIGAMLGDGGAPEGEEEDPPDDGGPRPLSPVESRIVHRMFRDIIRDVVEVWPDGSPPDVVLDGQPGNSRIIDIQVSEEEVVAVTFVVGAGGDEFGRMVLGIPTQTLRNVGQKKERSAQPKPVTRQPKMERVMPVEVEVVAEMARVPMRVRDLRHLRAGDLLPLGPLDAAKVRVNGRALMQGEPGVANGQRSIRVRKKID